MLADRVSLINPSPTLALTARAQQMRRDGIDVIAFTAGEPDFDTPEFIKGAAIEAIHAGYTKYTASAGTPELREAIAQKLRRENGLEYSPGQIVASCGAKHSVYNAIMALVNPGDEAIIPTPCWVTYPEQTLLAGGRPVFVETLESDGFVPREEAVRRAITPKTKVIIVNSPNNPTGAAWPKETLESLVRIASEHDLYLISDEIYEHLVYDGGQAVSIAGLSQDAYDRTVTINGVSKTYAMTGWRLGYAAAPLEIAKAMSCLQDQATSNPCTISQYAAIGALNSPPDWIEKMSKAFDSRRRIMVEGLNEIDGLSCAMPQGAFYALANVQALFDGKVSCSTDLCERLLEKARVAVVPGEAFMAPGFIRLSYASHEEVIRRGLERIADAIKELRA